MDFSHPVGHLPYIKLPEDSEKLGAEAKDSKSEPSPSSRMSVAKTSKKGGSVRITSL